MFSTACAIVRRGARVWCCNGVVIFTNCAPVAQLDQSVWLRTRRSGVRISPGAPVQPPVLLSVIYAATLLDRFELRPNLRLKRFKLSFRVMLRACANLTSGFGRCRKFHFSEQSDWADC